MLNQSTQFNVASCTSAKPCQPAFRYSITSVLYKPFTVSAKALSYEIRIFNAENIEVCIDENDANNVFAAAYDIVDQTNWRKIAINAKYEKQSRKVKSISFNRESEADLLHFVENQKDFSNWVKSKILEEVSKSHG